MIITTRSGVVINSRQITTISDMFYNTITEYHSFEITLSSQQEFTFMDKDKGKMDKEREKFISLIRD